MFLRPTTSASAGRGAPHDRVFVATATIIAIAFTTWQLCHLRRDDPVILIQKQPFSVNRTIGGMLGGMIEIQSGPPDGDTKLVPMKLEPRRLPDIVMKQNGHKSNRTVKQIALLGERNTGTTWITAHLRECFNHTLPVKTELVRHKHWFQHDVLEKKRVYDTLVVSEFRNPCYWVEAMKRKCYLAPMHYKVKDWKKFVTTPWTLPGNKRLQYDLDLLEENKLTRGGDANYSAILCQQNFSYEQINSCLEKPYLEGKIFIDRAKNRRKKGKHPIYGDERDRRSGQEPFYELRNDGSGTPYANLLEMRSDKIKNFIEVAEWDWVKAVLPVQYDELVKDGTQSLIQNIEKITGVKAKCKPSPPQNRSPKPLPDDFVHWMMEHVDWETEALVGYKKC